MKTQKKVLSLGSLLIMAGAITVVMSPSPSQLLQYIFIGISIAMGAVSIAIGQQTKRTLMRSYYYKSVGIILMVLAVALGIWATTLLAFVSVLGFFVLLLGILEFVFAQQILTTEKIIPWKLVGIKLVISTMAATGSVWVMTMVNFDAGVALLFLGLLFILVGLGFVYLSRISFPSAQIAKN